MKSIFCLSACCLTLTAGVNAAGYVTDFDDFTGNGDDVAGQDGFAISDTTDQFSATTSLGILSGGTTTTSPAILLGDASVVDLLPTGPEVELFNNSTTGNFVNTTTVGTSVMFDFVLIDSFTDPDFGGRDTFGVSLSNGTNNVLSVIFEPAVASPVDPDSEEAFWNVSYTAGLGPTVPLDLAVVEGALFSLSIDLTQNAD